MNKIGVIIPFFREHEKLERCLAHLRAQTYTNLDVFVRDNTNDNIYYTAAVNEGLKRGKEALDGLVTLMRTAESETVRLGAMREILDRALGKAPQHVDVSAIKHTEIVYRSAEQIRQELIARGVPQVLLDYDKSK